MLRRDWKLDQLRALDVFSGTPTRTLREVGRATTLLRLPAGKVLWTQGSTAREAFLLLDGELDLTWNGLALETVSAGVVVGGVGIDAPCCNGSNASSAAIISSARRS